MLCTLQVSYWECGGIRKKNKICLGNHDTLFVVDVVTYACMVQTIVVRRGRYIQVALFIGNSRGVLLSTGNVKKL